MNIESVAFGVSMNDIVFPSGKTYMGVLGGGGPQTAWGMAAALGSGNTVGLVARVGSDLSSGFFASLERARINLDGVQITGLPTPRAWEVIDSDETRTHLWRVPGDVLAKQMVRGWSTLPRCYRVAENFHWGVDAENSGKDAAHAQVLRGKGKNVSLEPYRLPDYPLKIDALQRLIRSCNILSLSWLDACRLTGCTEYPKIIAKLQKAGCETLVVHRDKNGADVWDLNKGRGLHVPAVRTRVVDIVGAGNTFSGAFLAQLQNGIETAASHASVAASYMIEQVGLPKNLPTFKDYNRRRRWVQSGARSLNYRSC